MFTLFRLMAGRRLVLLGLLAMLAAAGTPAVRDTATRLLACGVSWQSAGLFPHAGASLAEAMSGKPLPRRTPQQCLREAMRTTAAARTWIEGRRRAP